MPWASSRPCKQPGCGNLEPCADHPEPKQWHYFYNTARWKRYRIVFLQEHRFCVYCERRGYLVIATVVDHIKAHKGDYDLMWSSANHQALCAGCHNAKSRSETEEPGLDRG